MCSNGPCLCCIKTCQNIFTSPVKRNKRKLDKLTLTILIESWWHIGIPFGSGLLQNKMTPSGDALGSGHFCYVAKRFFVKIKESYYFNRFNVTGTNVFRSNVARSTDVVPIGLPMKFLLILMRFRQSIKRDCASIHLYLCISRHLKYFKYYLQGIVVF